VDSEDPLRFQRDPRNRDPDSEGEAEHLFVIKFRPAKNLAPLGPLERSHHAASCHTYRW
jgi:hypothetical protein